MSALTVAAALDALLAEAPSWLPDVRSWEIAEDGDDWVLSGGLADDLGEAKAAQALGLVAGEHGVVVADDGRRMSVPFVWQGARGRLWYSRPVLRWVVPERCATCPTKLGAPDVRFVKLGEALDAPVVCIPCRDRMHAAWLAGVRPSVGAPLVVNTSDGLCWTRRAVTRGGLPLYAPEGVCSCPEFVMATLPELVEHGIVGSADVLPMPVGPQPSLAETLEKRTELLHIVQATARRLRKEADGRKAYGARLKADNAHLTAVLHKSKAYVRAVETLLAERTPFAPHGQEATLLAIGWLRESLDDYRGRVDSAEAFARRTQARISALLVEPSDLQGCALCSASKDGHGVRVAERFEHEWTRPTEALVRERQAMQRQLERSASGEPAESELLWLRARVAELEAERHSTNEVLSDVLVERSADKLTRLLAPTQALREDESAAEQPLVVFQASHESIVMGLYATAAVARAHCEALMRRDVPGAALDWIEDEEDGVAELAAAFGEDERPTGYVVTALEIASAYDEEAGE
ncbi:hypothetical protein [Streptomyces huasconensis]|uniref:hypothetical protein n=1 Tax=Streptomyces huasconensis TaxID=1854574 RepID=UPI0036FE6509